MKKKLIIPVAVVATGAVVAKMIQKRRKAKNGSYRSSNISSPSGGPTRYAKKHSRRSARPSRGGA